MFDSWFTQNNIYQVLINNAFAIPGFDQSGVKVKIVVFCPVQQPTVILGQVLSIVTCGDRTYTEVSASN